MFTEITLRPFIVTVVKLLRLSTTTPFHSPAGFTAQHWQNPAPAHKQHRTNVARSLKAFIIAAYLHAM